MKVLANAPSITLALAEEQHEIGPGQHQRRKLHSRVGISRFPERQGDGHQGS